MTLSHRIIIVVSAAIILICPLIIDPYITLAFAAPKMAVLQLGALIGMAVVLIHWLRARHALESERLPRGVAFAFTAWMIWMGLTMFWSVLPQLSLVGNFYWQLGLFTKISLVSLAYLTFIASRETRYAELLLRLLIIASVPVVIYGLLQTINRDPITWWLMGKVVFSTFGNPNYFAGYLIMVMPPTLIESLRSKVRLWQVICALLFVEQLICFVATDSRGGFIAGFAALVLCLYWLWRFNAVHARRLTQSLIFLSLVLTLLIGLGGESLGDALRQVGFVKNLGSVETRQYAWETAWHMIALRPQGWGIGTFEIMHLNYATPGFMTYAQKFLIPFGAVMDRTHNMWTEVGVELGAIGLLIWIGLLAVVGDAVFKSGSPSFNGNWAGTLSGATGKSRRAVEEREKIGVFIASFDYAAQVRRSAQDASRQSRESLKSSIINYQMIGVLAGMTGYLLHLIVNPSEIGGEIVFWWLLGWGLGASCRQPLEWRAPQALSFVVIAAMFGMALFGFVYARQFFLF
jgi:O-antigen ligase